MKSITMLIPKNVAPRGFPMERSWAKRSESEEEGEEDTLRRNL